LRAASGPPTLNAASTKRFGAKEDDMQWCAWVTVMAMAAAAPALAEDRYEGYPGSFDDDGVGTYVELLPGQIQVHDLENGVASDEDWSFVQETLRHSYEVTVANTALRWTSSSTVTEIAMNRVDESGAILTPGAPTLVYNGSFAVRWIATPMTRAYSFIRVQGLLGMPSSAAYEIQLRDTTYMVPRFNNANGQSTVLMVQNTTNRELTANAYFYRPDGTLLHTEPFGLQPYGLFVLNTSTLAPLQNRSGSAAIAHIGPYGALSGKAVAVEPSTGFTFDTALTPIPY
jgi:hypothetical protein